MSFSFHHMLYTKPQWESQSTSKMLRTNPWLIVPLEESGHRELHREIPAIAVLPPNVSQFVRNNFEPVKGNHVASLLELIGVINEAGKHPRSTPIERSIGEVCIDGLQLQIPYIQDSRIEVPYVMSVTRTRDLQRGEW